MIGRDANALASSIVLVCRKRPADAPVCTRRDFLTALKRELRPALVNLQQSNIAPVDMAQSAIGPGMAVYSHYAQVLEADGTPMTVRTALQIINQELDQYFSEQDGALDRDTIFCVALYTQYAFREGEVRRCGCARACEEYEHRPPTGEGHSLRGGGRYASCSAMRWQHRGRSMPL